MRCAIAQRKPGQRWPGFCLLACLSCGAQAQIQHSSDYLARMDADGDGRVSLAEYQDWMSYAFDAMDRDHDGVLAAAELPGGRGRSITRSAHRERLAAGFRRQDRDGDGVLDAGELAAPPR
jgi:Ca2+-binding EF-hand superfamily protein